MGVATWVWLQIRAGYTGTMSGKDVTTCKGVATSKGLGKGVATW